MIHDISLALAHLRPGDVRRGGSENASPPDGSIFIDTQLLAGRLTLRIDPLRSNLLAFTSL